MIRLQLNHNINKIIWYDLRTDFAVIEPVCVISSCRSESFGTNVVLEGLRRAKRNGAKYAVVGSNLEFYRK